VRLGDVADRGTGLDQPLVRGEGRAHRLAVLRVRLGPGVDSGGLEHDARLHDVAHLIGVVLGDDDPSVGDAGDQPFGGQHAERLPDRAAAHPQGVGQRDLPQRGAGREVPGEERLAQRFRGPVDG